MAAGMLLCAIVALGLGSGLSEGDPSPVIPPGLESEVKELFRPYLGETPIEQSWHLRSIRIDHSRIVAGLTNDAGDTVELQLVHPSVAPREAERSNNFAFEISGSDAVGRRAATTLLGAVRNNDSRSLWFAPTRFPRRELMAVSTLLLTLVLVVWELRRCRRRSLLWLLGITVAGALLRSWLSLESPMTAWPFARVVPMAAALWMSPILQWWTALTGGEVFLWDLIHSTSFWLAVVTPAALFLHARQLFGSDKTALVVAALLAFSPHHLRYSAADTYFVQSMLLSSLAFAALHIASHGRGAIVWVAYAALPLLMIAVYDTRPLNMVFLPLFVGVTGMLWRAKGIGIGRAAALLVSIIAVGILGFLNLLEVHSEQIGHGLTLSTLWKGIVLLVDPSANAMLSPWVTPPALVTLAGIGLAACWRTMRGHFWLLLFWYLAFHGTHALIVGPLLMNARYHLHMLIPALMLAAVGLIVVVNWHRWLGIALVASLALAPVLHRDFIQFDLTSESHEAHFVRELRPLIPDGCTVFEHPGRQTGLRLDRLAQVVRDGRSQADFRVISLLPPKNDGRMQRDRLIESPPRCVMFYRGVNCVDNPECDELQSELTTTEVLAEHRFSHDPIDDNYIPTADRGREVRLSLIRLGPPK